MATLLQQVQDITGSSNTKVNDYLRMIEDIYNWHNSNPIKLW